MTLLLLCGLIIIFLVVMNRSKLYSIIPFDFKIIESVSKKEWFRNPWLSGLALFFINTVYFGLTGLILFLLMSLMVPFLHLVIMLAAVVSSILTWTRSVNRGKGRNPIG
ncbi:hypothetical protein ACJROX_09205 [Pseudalkalibacillus sp. A8]|uniref:hypothetical protein n=1 Tax=Pseudalkalibacillus sp. A8 TaxID=3382641 RepID=UPI0038B6AECB